MAADSKLGHQDEGVAPTRSSDFVGDFDHPGSRLKAPRSAWPFAGGRDAFLCDVLDASTYSAEGGRAFRSKPATDSDGSWISGRSAVNVRPRPLSG